jgi:hypothetical protein
MRHADPARAFLLRLRRGGAEFARRLLGGAGRRRPPPPFGGPAWGW